MDQLKETLKAVIQGYTGKALNGYSYLTQNADDTAFTVISVGNLPDRRVVNAGLIVQLAADKIVIERDVNDKPLVNALIQAGIAREQIILAYAGEAVDEFVTTI